jgi:hypothetical protein
MLLLIVIKPQLFWYIYIFLNDSLKKIKLLRNLVFIYL